MAGGVGTRFWPSSTEARPKQFLDILGIGKSLLRMTYERSLKLVENDAIIIMTNKRYFSLVKKELPELPNENILCEPSRNDTAPCIAYAALNINARNPLSSFAVLPSDHIILYEDIFTDRMNTAFESAEENNSIMTLGIQPSRPDTGYGYIHWQKGNNEVKKVISFKEKPSHEVAQNYLDSGEYLWNAGIFVWTTKSIIDAFEKYTSNIVSVLKEDTTKFNTSDEQDYIDEVYPLTEKISIDYAILEKADNVYTLPADIGWSDLGTWASLYGFSNKDENGNVIQNNNAVILDTTDTIVRIKDQKKIIIRGLSNFIVIDDDDALLIFPKDKEQEIKEALKHFEIKK